MPVILKHLKLMCIHPLSYRTAKLNLWVWGTNVLAVFVMIGVNVFSGAPWFFYPANLVGLLFWATLMRWSMIGYVRARAARDHEARTLADIVVFEQIIDGIIHERK